MDIFKNLNLFGNYTPAVGISSKKDIQKKNENPSVYTGDYSISMFRMNLNNNLNQTVGQNLYYLS